MSNLVRHPSSMDLCHKRDLPLDSIWLKDKPYGRPLGLVGTEAISRETGV